MNKQPNNLINEKSPYLLQHAYNPVNWYPYGEEALNKAKEENKPIFLSIGYSTCHWCHVMEKESFEDKFVGELMNSGYIPIKVDREERPDLDNIYMTVCQNLTGSGGWPLNVIMTPDGEPFYAGTYFPKEARGQMPGLIDVLMSITDQWNENHERVTEIGRRVKEEIDKVYRYKTDSIPLNEDILRKTFNQLKENFDSKYGGFSDAPKFPVPHKLMFLLRYYDRTKDDKAIEMVDKTLDAMYRGGIYDHIGYGFSRYSTDKYWLAPHFEKMLYDNAMLAITYFEAFEVTNNEHYKKVGEEIIEYVSRELLDKDGGFYSSEDADSEGEEGSYYVFNPLETEEVLGSEDAFYFNYYFDITPQGNFDGKSIPNFIRNPYCDFNDKKIEYLRPKMLKYRKERMKLHKDDKILTSWNGMMISALAKAYKVTLKEEYLNMANKAVDFIFDKLIDEEGRLLARYREGEAKYLGYLDDYAYLVYGLIELYEASFNSSYLNKAVDLNNKMLKFFKDKEEGGFFMTGSYGEELIVRPKDFYDGAVPSGNSIATYNLLRLSNLTGDITLEEEADNQLKAVSERLYGGTVNYTFMMLAIDFRLRNTKELLIVREENSLEEFKNYIRNKPTFDLNIIVKDNYNKIEDIVDYAKVYKAIDNKTTYYLCENKTCLLGETDFEKIKDKI